MTTPVGTEERPAAPTVRRRAWVSGLVAASCVMYVAVLLYVLFFQAGRGMVVTSADMLDNYDYWNSVNLVPFKTIGQYVMNVIDGNARVHAIANLCGNLALLAPAGLYLPFFVRALRKARAYGVVIVAVIIVIEVVQLATKSGSLDIDDAMLNLAGAFIGYGVVMGTPLRGLFRFRAW